jgi:hypothetical protein
MMLENNSKDDESETFYEHAHKVIENARKHINLAREWLNSMHTERESMEKEGDEQHQRVESLQNSFKSEMSELSASVQKIRLLKDFTPGASRNLVNLL